MQKSEMNILGLENKRWKFSRQINLMVIIQLLFLASLIIGSWVDLQRQLCLVQHDIQILVNKSDDYQDTFAQLDKQTMNHEFRLQAVEQSLSTLRDPCAKR